jgi:curved DNA-binding protein CbpA
VQTFYQLLSLEPSASADDIKKAFRAEIARYHPDKVQHLGKEFQEMAATRAAQLTEAYRTLMNPEMRLEYDRLYVGGKPAAPAPAAPPPAGGQSQAPSRAPAYEPPVAQAPPPPSSGGDPAFKPPPRFAKEHATRDEFVKKATLGRIRQVVAAEHGEVAELTLKGFDFHCSTKSKKLFGRGGEQRIAVRFVPVVDRAAVQDTWALAQKGGGNMCVLLMGSGISSAKELGDAITDLLRKSRGDGGISIIPVDLRDWSAHIPEGAPPTCKNILLRLRESKM